MVTHHHATWWFSVRPAAVSSGATQEVTMTEKYGTGEELGRVDLGKLGELVFEDDGCSDPDTYIKLVRPNGDTASYGRNRVWARSEEDKGDEWVMEQLGNADHTAASGGGSSVSSFDRAPPAYTCDDCHRSWPRSSNQTPDSDSDICPECYDG